MASKLGYPDSVSNQVCNITPLCNVAERRSSRRLVKVKTSFCIWWQTSGATRHHNSTANLTHFTPFLCHSRKFPTPEDYEQSLCASRISIEHAADGHTAAAQPMATANSCRSLPGEIWDLICAQAEDFALWVAYRQVSKVVRSEAEREFVQTRLPKLCIKLPYSGRIPGLRYTCEHKHEDDEDVH